MKPKKRQHKTLQVVAFLRIYESGHKIWPKAQGCQTAPAYFNEFTTWALCHANPWKKPKLQKLIPNFQQFSPLSFFVVAESPNMNSVFFFQFLLKNPWENSQIRNFNSSFSASALAFFAASKASVSAFRFVPWPLRERWVFTRLSNFWDEFKSWKVSASKVEKHIGLLIGDWTNPSEKYDRKNGNLPQLVVKIKHIWNHHPD